MVKVISIDKWEEVSNSNNLDTYLHVYRRVSTVGQTSEDKSSLDTQLTEGKRTAERYGFKYIVDHNEEAGSATKKSLENRPKMQGIQEYISKKRIKHLYTYKWDRLSRDDLSVAFVLRDCEIHKVKLYEGTTQFDLNDPTAGFMVRTMVNQAMYFARLNTDRMAKGKTEHRKKGFWQGGFVPFGYDVQEKKLVIHEENSKVVNRIFDDYIDGKSLDAIRQELTVEGIKTARGKSIWSESALRLIIMKNDFYCGKMTSVEYETDYDEKGERYRKPIGEFTVQIPQIITESKMAKARSIARKRSYSGKNKNNNGTKKQKYTYVLQGLLECGSCGLGLRGRTERLASRSKYYCPNSQIRFRKSDIRECKYRSNIRIDETEDLIWDHTINVLSKSNTYKESFKMKILNEKTYANTSTDIEEIEGKIKYNQNEISKHLQLLGRYQTRRDVCEPNSNDRKRLDSQILEVNQIISEKEEIINEYTNHLERLNNTKTWVDWVGEFNKEIHRQLDETSKEKKRELLLQIIKKIVVHNPKQGEKSFNVTYHLPIIEDKYIVYGKDEKTNERKYKIGRGKKRSTIQ